MENQLRCGTQQIDVNERKKIDAQTTTTAAMTVNGQVTMIKERRTTCEIECLRFD